MKAKARVVYRRTLPSDAGAPVAEKSWVTPIKGIDRSCCEVLSAVERRARFGGEGEWAKGRRKFLFLDVAL